MDLQISGSDPNKELQDLLTVVQRLLLCLYKNSLERLEKALRT